MPSDANGNYSLPDGYLAETGQTILASQHNPPLEDLGESMTQRIMASGAKPFTGPAKFADGAVGAPAMTFNTGTSTGLYKTTDGIGVAVGGAMVAEFTSGGLRTGGHYLGELIPFSGITAQALTVLPYGQTLSRTTYAALWAFAQTEIAGGNTFYNNGNGSTTFGIGDMRGRVPAGWDSMGGSSANRLTNADDGLNGDTMGATGGGETQSLVTANCPAYTPAGTNSGGAVAFGYSTNGNFSATGASTGVTAINNNPGTGVPVTGVALSVNQTFAGTPQGGTAQAFGVVQPTIVVNYLLFAGA